MLDRLAPGDVLLYPPKGIFGRIIAFKTWHKVAHVEVFVGDGESVASRDGKGVNRYESRLGDVLHVLRPNQAVNVSRGLAWFESSAKGQPYGWWDLLAFAGYERDHSGMVCSPFATLFLRACGLQVFNTEPPNKVAPCSFLLSELLDDVTASVR